MVGAIFGHYFWTAKNRGAKNSRARFWRAGRVSNTQTAHPPSPLKPQTIHTMLSNMESSERNKLVVVAIQNRDASLNQSIDSSVNAYLNLLSGLKRACSTGDVAAIRDFLKRGANPNGDMDMNTPAKAPIHDAVENGHAEAVRVLLEAGANINLQDGSMKTALHYACEKNNVAVVRLLVDKKAKVDLRDGLGYETALHYACVKDNVELVRLLISAKAGVNVENRFGYTPLHCANSVEIAALLLDAGANLHAVNIHGETPLFRPINYNGDLVRFLCTRGAIPTARDTGGRTALHMTMTCMRTQPERIAMARDYMECGVPINAQDNFGNTALHLACGLGLVQVVIFLTHTPGVDITIQNKRGQLASGMDSTKGVFK